MTNKYSLKKADLRKFLENLSRTFSVYVPTQQKFERIEKVKEIDDCISSKIPPTSLLLPQMEELLRYKQGVITEAKSATPSIVFGIRPCDSYAFKLLDFTFLEQEPVDVYYKQRRDHLILFTRGCNEPDTTCFCQTFGLSPFYKDESDVFIWELDDSLVLEGISRRGEELLQELRPASTEMINRAEEKERCVTTDTIEIEGIEEKVKKMIGSAYWTYLQRSCIGCGTCTFVCPTCYCFDMCDLPRNGWGKRIRVWDSCMFRVYTHETSGHNPRPTLTERWMQRFMHKFSYYPELFKEFGCVGCGRCVRECPVNLDIREVLTDVMKFEKQVVNKK